MKISSDTRWMASGPGAGLGEITIPEIDPALKILRYEY
jgi:fumarate hydratase class II